MTGDTKAMSYGIIVTKSLLEYTKAKKATKTSIRLELCPSMRRKRDKISSTKNPKRGIVKSLTKEELKG